MAQAKPIASRTGMENLRNSMMSLSDSFNESRSDSTPLPSTGTSGVFYNITDSGTGEITKVPLNEAAKLGLWTNTLSQSNIPMYKVNGSWTSKEPVDAKVSLNEATGKITVTGNSKVVNNKDFQNQWKEELEQLSQAYKLGGKDAKMIRTKQDSGEQESITVSERLAELNTPVEIVTGGKTIKQTPLQSSAQYYNTIIANAEMLGSLYRQRNEDGTFAPIEFSEADIIRLSQSGTGEGTTDETRISVPLGISELEKVYAHEGWDNDSQTISIKDFKNAFYDLDKSGESAIENLHSDLERYLAEALATPTAANKVDTNKLTGALALYTYLNNSDPKMNFWTGASYVISAPLKGVGSFAANSGTELATFAVSVTDALQNFGQWLDATLSGRDTSELKEINNAQVVYQSLNFANQVAGQLPKYLTGDIDKDIQNAVNSLNLDIQSQVAKVKQLSDSLAGGSGSWNMNNAADAIAAITEGLMTLIATIGVGNAFERAIASGLSKAGGTFAATASRILAGGGTAKELSSAAAKLTSLLGAKTAAGLYNTLASITTSKVTGVAFGLAMETLGEGLVQNPTRLSKILAEHNLLSEDGIEYLGETLYGNAFGGVIGVTTSKALLKLGDTLPGRLMTATVRAKVYGLQTKIADAFDALRMKVKGYDDVMEWIEDTYNPKTAQIMIDNRAIRELRKKIAERGGIKIAGGGVTSVLKQLDEIDDMVTEMMRFENALDDYRRKSNLLIKQWQYSDTNPAFKATNKNLTELTGQIMQAEQKAGFKSAAKVHAGALFSQETTNYIGASVRVPILQNILENTTKKSTQKLLKSEIAHWTKVMSDYEGKASTELLNLVQQYSTNYKTWWNQAMSLFTKEGLLDPDDIKAWRESGQWGDHGELYARLQRRTEMDKYMVARTDGKVDTKLSRDLGHYGFGNTDDFVDPQLVMQQELRIQADIANRNSMIDAWSNLKGSTTIYTQEFTALKTEVAPQLKRYNNEAKMSLQAIVGDLDTEGYFAESFTKVNLEQKISQLQATNKRIARQVLKETPVTVGEQQVLVTAMSDSQIDSLYGLVTNDEPLENALVGFQSSKWGKTVRPEIQAEVDKLYKVGDLQNTRLTQANIRAALNSNPDLQYSIKRAIMATDPRVAEETYVKEIVSETRYSNFLDQLYESYNSNLEDIARLTSAAEVSKEQMQLACAKVLDGFGDTFYAKNTTAREIGEALGNRFGKDQPEVVKRYLMYDAMKHNKHAVLDSVRQQARSFFSKYKGAEGEILNAKQADQLANKLANQIGAEIDLRFNEYRNLVAQLGDDAKALIETRNWQREVYKEAREIGDRLQADNVFLMRNANGKFETVEVDPLLAGIVGTKPVGTEMTGFQKVNYMWMRLFRMGTTGINPTSMVNQYWRDTGNAWIMGNVTQTIKQSERVMSEVFGEDVGAALAQYSEEAQQNFLKLAKESGQDVADVIASSERARGRLVAQAGTETEAMRLYGDTRAMWYAGETVRETGFDKFNNAVDAITDKLGRLNEMRETYLRDLVYNNNMAKALKQGRSIEQARIYAEYIANNATTNFTRGTTFLSNFQNTIPYLRSAINGTKSFWRLWSLDPVGVTGRIIGGMMIPTIAITSMSLNGEENRNTYKNIPEYRKENALPLVVNGKYFSIPLPQELSAFVNPIRHAIESASGLHDGTGMEILVNDILAFSPLDLGGFTNIDSVDMFAPSGGTPWTQRFMDGFGQLFSQIAPKYLVSAATAVSGYDLYTGQKIDTSFVTIDPETGEKRVMSYSAGEFSKFLASIFGENCSAPVAQEVLDTLFGDTPQDILDWLWGVGAGAIESINTGNMDTFGTAFESATSKAVNLITKVNAPYIEDLVDSAWRDAVSELYDLKMATLSGDAWQAYVKNARNAVSQTEKDAANTARANILNEYYGQVKLVVNNLLDTYGGSLTAERYASVISLMTMSETTSYSPNALTDEANQDLYDQNRNAAIQTMIEMGFPPTATDSVWGRYKTNADGTVSLQYATPLQLMDMKNTRYNQSDLHEANIRKILQDNHLTRGEMFKGYNAATTKSERKQAKAEWNAKVIDGLYPYIKRYGANTTITTAVADLLEDYIFVDNPYTAKQYLIKIFGGN